VGVNNVRTNIRVQQSLVGLLQRSSVSLVLGFRVTVTVSVSLVSQVCGSSLVGVCRHLAAIVTQYYRLHYRHDRRGRY